MNLFIQTIMQLVFPTRCIFCKAQNPEFVCKKHKTLLQLKKHVQYSKTQTKILTVSNYHHPPIQTIIRLFKFDGLFGLAPFIGQSIAEQLSDDIPPNSILIPIPLHWRRTIWRGFNQSNKIAQAIQSHRPDLQICYALNRTKKTAPQAKLSKTDRQKNLTNVFRMNSNIPAHATVFLIDDVYTTGATIESAKKTLQAQKINNIQAICFAQTPAT